VREKLRRKAEELNRVIAFTYRDDYGGAQHIPSLILSGEWHKGETRMLGKNASTLVDYNANMATFRVECVEFDSHYHPECYERIKIVEGQMRDYLHPREWKKGM